MGKKQIIGHIVSKLKIDLRDEATGHDWWHVKRVHDLAVKIAKQEKGADMFLVQMIALLHDLDDWKIVGKKESRKLPNARQMLSKMGVADKDQKVVLQNIAKISFKGTGKNIPPDLEGRVVQDADRLDGLGAIGIARVFAVGGKFHRMIFNPKIKPKSKSSHPSDPNNTSINHFYEKILKLKDFLNTRSAKKIALSRHKFVEQYLKEFFLEWQAKK